MKSLSCAIAVVALCSTASAANLLTNGSFENGTFSSNRGTDESQLLATPDPSSTDITGWTVTGPDDIAWLQNGNRYGITAEDGARNIDLTGYDDASPYSGVSQVVNLAAGEYSLSFYLGADQSNSLYSGPVSVTTSVNALAQNFTFTPAVGATGNVWQQETMDFNVGTGGNVTVKIQGLSGDQYIGLDNVDLESVASVAPEPMMALPLALGFGLIWYLRRRRVTAAVQG